MKKLNFTWKIWMLIIILLISLVSIFGLPPRFLDKGILITSVDQNSTAFNEGLRKGQIIISIDGKKVNNIEDYSNIITEKLPSEEKIRLNIQTKDTQIILFTNTSPEISVSNLPKTNIKTGLDITGGSRALVQAKDVQLNSDELNDLVDITRNRINVYGISDVKVLPVSDLSGNNYMLVEVAGATPKDLKDLIHQN